MKQRVSDERLNEWREDCAERGIHDIAALIADLDDARARVRECEHIISLSSQAQKVEAHIRHIDGLWRTKHNALQKQHDKIVGAVRRIHPRYFRDGMAFLCAVTEEEWGRIENLLNDDEGGGSKPATISGADSDIDRPAPSDNVCRCGECLNVLRARVEETEGYSRKNRDRADGAERQMNINLDRYNALRESHDELSVKYDSLREVGDKLAKWLLISIEIIKDEYGNECEEERGYLREWKALNDDVKHIDTLPSKNREVGGASNAGEDVDRSSKPPTSPAPSSECCGDPYWPLRHKHDCPAIIGTTKAEGRVGQLLVRDGVPDTCKPVDAEYGYHIITDSPADVPYKLAWEASSSAPAGAYGGPRRYALDGLYDVVRVGNCEQCGGKGWVAALPYIATSPPQPEYETPDDCPTCHGDGGRYELRDAVDNRKIHGGG